MPKRKIIDWELIEKEYRLGQVSIREIARIHKIQPSSISRKAKKKNWQRDHSNEIKHRTKATLQSNSKSNTPTQEDITKAVQANVEVIRSHRKDIRKGRELVELFSDQLNDAAKTRDELEDQIFIDTKAIDGGKPSLKRRNTMLKAVALPSHASVLRDLSTTLKNLIPLERQAFSLDDDGLVSIDEVLAAAERVNPKLAQAIQEQIKNA